MSKFRIAVFAFAALGMGIALWFFWAMIRVIVHLLPFIAIGGVVLLVAFFGLRSKKGNQGPDRL